MHYTKCIFRNDPDPAHTPFFERVMEAIDALRRFGVALDMETDEQTADGSQTLVWSEPEELVFLTLTKDAQTEICAFTVAATRQHDLRRICDVLGQHLDFVPESELLEIARQRIVMEPEVLVKLAMINGRKRDPEVVGVIVDALEHRFPQVRYYAAYSAALTLWPEFIPELDRLLKLEPDVDVREMANRALDVCRDHERRNANGRR